MAAALAAAAAASSATTARADAVAEEAMEPTRCVKLLRREDSDKDGPEAGAAEEPSWKCSAGDRRGDLERRANFLVEDPIITGQLLRPGNMAKTSWILASPHRGFCLVLEAGAPSPSDGEEVIRRVVAHTGSDSEPPPPGRTSGQTENPAPPTVDAGKSGGGEIKTEAPARGGPRAVGGDLLNHLKHVHSAVSGALSKGKGLEKPKDLAKGVASWLKSSAGSVQAPLADAATTQAPAAVAVSTSSASSASSSERSSPPTTESTGASSNTSSGEEEVDEEKEEEEEAAEDAPSRRFLKGDDDSLVVSAAEGLNYAGFLTLRLPGLQTSHKYEAYCAAVELPLKRCKGGTYPHNVTEECVMESKNGRLIEFEPKHTLVHVSFTTSSDIQEEDGSGGITTFLVGTAAAGLVLVLVIVGTLALLLYWPKISRKYWARNVVLTQPGDHELMACPLGPDGWAALRDA